MPDLPRSDTFEIAGDRCRTEVTLAVGDAVRAGDLVCTVVEIEDGEVHLRVDPLHECESIPTDRFAAAAR